MLKLLSLFSGIGAFEKALSRQGIPYELVGYCEIDKYASKSYSAIHGVSETKNLLDVTKVNPEALPKDIDIITYGFPCQDISICGFQKGFHDENGALTRSGLFFEALRIIERTKPKIAIAENVRNLTGKRFKETFKTVLSSLEAAGYNNYWQILNSKDYGIPQNRERVFIVSIRKDVDNGLFKFPEVFPLKLRLKDMLETEPVSDKYYLSDKGIRYVTNPKRMEKHYTQINGDIATPLMAKGNTNWTGTFIAEPNVTQIANVCPTKTRDNPNQGRVYDSNGISPALNCMGGGNRQPFIIVKATAVTMRGRKGEDGVNYQNVEISEREFSNAITTVQKDSLIAEYTQPLIVVSEDGKYATVRVNNSKGFDIAAEEEDSINFEQPNSKTRRGRVGHEVAQTLTTSCNQGVLIDSRIRKLTPKECFRLMGFDDVDFEAARKVNSDTQLYKQAGNSIVVDVLEKLFCMMLDENGEIFV